MLQVLSQLLVGKFYKLNAGFFLFLVLILFGIMPASDSIQLHRALMVAAVSSLPGILAAALLSLLYMIKCSSFALRELTLPENVFIHNMQGVTDSRQLTMLVSVFAALFAPLLAYGSIAVGVGIQAGKPLALALAVLLAGGVVAGACILFRAINTTWQPPVITLPQYAVFSRRSFLSYLLHYSVNSKKGVFISVKIFSLLALQLLVALNADKVSKENICFLILLSISAHALLPVYFVQFAERDMAFLRALPIPRHKRLAQFVVTYAVVLLPELFFLVWNEFHILPGHVILSVYLLAVTRLTFFSVVQYIPGWSTDRYTGFVFIIFFVSIILLASVSLWIFIMLEAVLSVFIFYRRYYHYECADPVADR